MDLSAYWSAVLEQREGALAAFFCPGAEVFWPNTNECFTAAEFVRANCAYPGSWAGEIQRIVETGGQIITAVRVWDRNSAASFHVVSFFRLREGKILRLEEYWGDDGEAPRWRREMGIGRPIR